MIKRNEENYLEWRDEKIRLPFPLMQVGPLGFSFPAQLSQSWSLKASVCG